MHERLARDLMRFRIAPLYAQCVGQQLSCLLLRCVIATRERQRFAAADFSLPRIVFCS
jgi:hypothetical protein